MNTFQLTCFLAVANCLSFARAASHMNVTQPTITHQIKTLEDELGVRLFRRSTRMVELTPEGQAFLNDAKNMVGIADQAKRRFHSASDRKINAISIGMSNYAQLDTLSEILNLLSRFFPNLHPRLHVVPHEQLLHLLETGTADAIFGIRESSGEREKLQYRELALSAFVGICRSDHPLARQEEVTLDTLKREALIFCDPFTSSAEVARLQMQLAVDKDPADIHFCPSAAATFVLAAAGLGVAVIPELFVPKAPGISKIRLADAPKISFGLFYNADSADPVLKRFVQITGERYADLPGEATEKEAVDKPPIIY